jgi:hypothetical protein
VLRGTHCGQTMLKPPRSLLLLLICYLLPLTADFPIEVKNDGISCQVGRRKLRKVPDLQKDCYAALSLVPNTGIEVDPQSMSLSDLKSGSEKLFSLRLTGNNTYRITDDKIRFPAEFMSGICLVEVYDKLKYKPGNQALFNYIYV